NRLAFLEVESEKVVGEWETDRSIGSVAVLPDSATVALAPLGRGQIEYRRIQDGKKVDGIAPSVDLFARLTELRHRKQVASIDYSGTIRVWNREGEIVELSHGRWGQTIVPLCRDRWLVTGDWKGCIKVWELSDKSLYWTIRLPKDEAG